LGRPYSQRRTESSDKTLFDWLQLLSALAIPVVIAIGGWWFTWAQNNTQREVEDQRAQAETLRAYLDQMTHLLLDKGLRDSKPDDEVRTLARARTSTVITRLDAEENGSVTRFLSEVNLTGGQGSPFSLLEGAELQGADLENALLIDSNLIAADLRNAVLKGARLENANLSAADLSDADLSGAALVHADLTGVRLDGADLTDARLDSADLSDVDLRGADISDAYLNNANLATTRVNEDQLSDAASLKGATMPGGSKHP
jgi:hypothetical protein